MSFFILLSCTPAKNITPTEIPLPDSTVTPIPATTTSTFIPATPTPTITSTPIPSINIEGQNFPDPRFSNSELFNLEKQNAPIPQFVQALSLAGVNVSAQTISESLIYKVVKAKNGELAVLLMTTDLIETTFSEANIPLLIYSSVVF